MATEYFEKILVELTRKGEQDKVRLLKGLHKRLMPSQFDRIKKNDKSVLVELLMPKWVSWKLLRAWAEGFEKPETGKTCILCNSRNENGITFNDRFVCETCFVRIKQLE